MSRKNSYRSLSIEQLENRIVFAGDVTAVLNGNTLKIDGDDLGNQILVQRFAADQYRVTGLNGTTINGQAVQNFNIDNEQADLRINLKGGDDLLEMDDFNGLELRAAKLAVEMGTGSDVVDIDDIDIRGNGGVNFKLGGNENEADVLRIDDSEFAGTVKITTGGGNDEIDMFRNLFDRDLQIDTAAGDDDVDLDTITAANVSVKLGDGVVDFAEFRNFDLSGKLTVDGGNGDDAVELDDVKAAEVQVDFRKGSSDLQAEQVEVVGRFNAKGGDVNNAIGMDDVQAAELKIDYAKGVTDAEFNLVTAGLFSIKTGKGNDTVSVANSVVVDFLVNLGDGNDQMAIDLMLNLNAKIDLGKGNDTLDVVQFFSNGDLTVLGKDGDDVVTLDTVQAATALLDGGNGNDTLTEVNVAVNDKEVKNFELVN